MWPHNYKHLWQSVVTDIGWTIWNRLGLLGSGGRNRHTTDIEAAIVLAAHIIRRDARLLDGVQSWLRRYSRIINHERLAALLRDNHNEELARSLGGLLTSAGGNVRQTSLRTCRALCTTAWKPEPLLQTARPGIWKTADPHWKAWGLLHAPATPRVKLHDHTQILRQSMCIRHRYIFGPSLRADILYLLAVSTHNRAKYETSHLTNVRLAMLLGSHHSTIYRIQQDLEAGGILQPAGGAPNQHTATWSVRDPAVFIDTRVEDASIVHWSRINAMLLALAPLARQLDQTADEALHVVMLNQFHQEWFPMLADHGVAVPIPYGKALGPLKAIRSEHLLRHTTQALQALRDFLLGKNAS